MKSKKILVLSLSNASLKSQVDKDITYEKIVRDLVGEGREIRTATNNLKNKRTVFQDGSSVSSAVVGDHLRGGRYTHIYTEKGLNANDLIKAGLFSLLNGNLENWETSGNRVFSYHVSKVNDVTVVNIEKY